MEEQVAERGGTEPNFESQDWEALGEAEVGV